MQNRASFILGTPVCCAYIISNPYVTSQWGESEGGIEKDIDDLAAHFKGGIYGEDENGNWIVGYGVSGSANIVVTPDHVEFGSAKSEPFSPEAKAALAGLRQTMANC